MPKLRLAYPFLCTLALLVAGCGAAGPVDGPDREAFIATFVDLRDTALQSGAPLTEAQRTEILAKHQITEDELMQFVEVHGRDVEYMAKLWDEVEARIDEATPKAVTP